MAKFSKLVKQAKFAAKAARPKAARPKAARPKAAAGGRKSQAWRAYVGSGTPSGLDRNSSWIPD